MSADKYLSIFSRQMEAIVYILSGPTHSCQRKNRTYFCIFPSPNHLFNQLFTVWYALTEDSSNRPQAASKEGSGCEVEAVVGIGQARTNGN